ncbi:Bifunctional protein [Streptomyces sp. RB5]|uniref:Bifunctional protein n=1 Tax=Streptomyces smaragdinus TaxID=2585196 RepID=A0A7K0CCR0_9ACTN|nr:bifunctional RNase H/acid phosphatase [Streptomyces smaragdinus]MQY11239.1 Bifunctional protein [Streptomyces smaragdinus]
MPERFVIEADGGSRGNPGPAGYGALVRDAATGGVLAEAAEYIGVATNNVAEYRGLVAGLRAAYALDPTAGVLVRMDSKLVVEQMSGRWKIKHPDMKPLAAEAKGVFPPGQVSYEWIPREKNKHADRLANEAMDAGRRGERWSPQASAAEDSARTPAVGWGSADLGAPTTLVLLRHGETALTPQKRFSGVIDPPLSDVGRRQAAGAAAMLAERGTVQAVVSSPLGRCQETARVVASRLGLTVETDEGLRETDFGAWEGLTFAEVQERWPDDLTAWLGSPQVAPTGGGESFAAVARRVAAARDRLLERFPGRTVLVVTHVTPIKQLVRLALGAPPEALYRMELSAASLSAVAYYADGNASVRLVNDTGHLRATS